MRTKRRIALLLCAMLLLSVFSTAVCAENAQIGAGTNASACDHSKVNYLNGARCELCGAQMRARIFPSDPVPGEITRAFETFEEALAVIPSNREYEISPLVNLHFDDDITITGKKVKYCEDNHFNCSIDFADGKSLIVSSDGQLTMCDSRSINHVTVENNGNLYVQDNASIGSLVIKNGGNIELSTGSYDKIEIQAGDKTLRSLLPTNMVMRYRTTNAWIYENDSVLNGKRIEDVLVTQAPLRITSVSPEKIDEEYTGSNSVHISVCLSAKSNTFVRDTVCKWYKDDVQVDDAQVNVIRSDFPSRIDTDITDTNVALGTHVYKCTFTYDGYVVEKAISVVLFNKITPDITVQPITAEYSETAVSPTVISKYAAASVQGTPIDGTWSWKNGVAPTEPSDSGTYTIVFTPVDIKHYNTAEKEVTVTVTPANLDAYKIIAPDSFVYSGAEQKPTVLVEHKTNGNVLRENVDYSVVYDENADYTNVGVKTFKIVGMGKFAGNIDGEYQITGKQVTPQITLETDTYIYDGSAKTPSVTVQDDSTLLTKDVDYTVSYENNTNAGNAKVKIALIGNYVGEAEKEFVIQPKTITPVISIAKPVVGNRPQTTAETSEYTAVISWTPTGKEFAYNTVYTAKVIITPKENYTVLGIAENGYTVSGAVSVVSAANSGEVSAAYAQTPRRGNGGGSTRYPIYFETNGGSAVAAQYLKKGEYVKEPEAPKKEGYVFAGWYADKGLKTKFDFSELISKTVTLYAAWTPNTANAIVLTIGEKNASVFGKTTENDVAPKIIGSRTMLPARFIAESLGAKVDWNEDKQQVTITGKHVKTGDDITVLLTIGESKAYVNGKEVGLDAAAFVENDRTYTPVRFISECLGAEVEWFEATQQVYIVK